MNEGELTDDQAAALGAASLCCCFVSVVALVVFIIWLVRRQQGAAATAQRKSPTMPPAGVSAPPVAGAAPPQPAVAPAPAPAAGAPHLSVMAVGFDARWRLSVEAVTGAPPTAHNLLDARVELVHRAARALLEVEPHWTHFGYGEKDLPDVAGAQQSYQFAFDDFRARAQVAAEPQGTFVVAVLIIATRSHLHGVSRLDERAQARASLADRLELTRDTLLGAELLWAPPAGAISSDTLIQQFPEVHLLTAVPTGNV